MRQAVSGFKGCPLPSPDHSHICRYFPCVFAPNLSYSIPDRRFSSDQAHLVSPCHGFCVCFCSSCCFSPTPLFSFPFHPLYHLELDVFIFSSLLFSRTQRCLLDFIVGRRYLLNSWTPPVIMVTWPPCSAACLPLSLLCFPCRLLSLHTAYTQFTVCDGFVLVSILQNT